MNIQYFKAHGERFCQDALKTSFQRVESCFWYSRHTNRRIIQQKNSSCCLIIDLVFSVVHMHAFMMSVLIRFDVFYSHGRRWKETHPPLKNMQSDGVSNKQLQRWHGLMLLPRAPIQLRHFNNAVSVERCPKPPFRHWSGSCSHYMSRNDGFVSWTSRLRMDGWRLNKTWDALVFTSCSPSRSDVAWFLSCQSSDVPVPSAAVLSWELGKTALTCETLAQGLFLVQNINMLV